LHFVPRRPRDFEPGLYHLTARGNRRERLFVADRDRSLFCEELAKASQPDRFLVRAYCLMSTHYHLVVETETGEVSAGMRDLNGTYAKRFNKEHGVRGHLFEERFYGGAITSDWHLLEVLRYLALNPVRAALCAAPAGWRWGSFAAVMGKAPAPPFLEIAWTLRLFSREDAEARRQLSSFVEYAPELATP
jgi:REP-associated tyrosine transposase